jgi:hypothetical protein
VKQNVVYIARDTLSHACLNGAKPWGCHFDSPVEWQSDDLKTNDESNADRSKMCSRNISQ